ncbi:MAG TPA: hypothetical protein EYQ26_02940 [Rhodospirillales bacterium]|nr:hypothetical protein [Rhodospirillales bacterium]
MWPHAKKSLGPKNTAGHCVGLRWDRTTDAAPGGQLAVPSPIDLVWTQPIVRPAAAPSRRGYLPRPQQGCAMPDNPGVTHFPIRKPPRVLSKAILLVPFGKRMMKCIITGG